MLAIERLEERENFIAALAIEVAGGFVAQEQRGVGDDGARDADALLFTAGELAGKVVGAVYEADDFERGGGVLAALFF